MGRPVRDLSKEGPFGRLSVVENAGRTYGRNVYWKCVCVCGNEITARGSHLVAGNVKSCGCLAREHCSDVGGQSGGRNRTHGISGTPEHYTYRGMIRRCYDPLCESYADYGGRGIRVCERWLESPLNFVEDMGSRPTGTTLDRINNNEDYEPSNCRWATNRERQTNKRNNRLMALNGVTMTAAEWSESIGCNYKSLLSRIYLGWSDERALTTPFRERNMFGGSTGISS